MKITVAPVISNDEIMPGTHLAWLDCPEVAAKARPGRFIMVHCGEDTFLRRPLSIHRVDGDKIALLFAVAGKGTAWLAGRSPGDEVAFFGPLGNGFTLPDAAQNILLVAGGAGIAPLVFLAETALAGSRRVRLLNGAQASSGLYPGGQLPSGVEFIAATEDGIKGQKGLATDLLPDFLDSTDQIFACGPLPMYRTMSRMPELKNKSVQVSLEMRMACGLGICYGCTVRTAQGLKQVCKDGPVFDLHEIIWDELIPTAGRDR